MLSVIMLNVILLSVVMLRVVAPPSRLIYKKCYNSHFNVITKGIFLSDQIIGIDECEIMYCKNVCVNGTITLS